MAHRKGYIFTNKKHSEKAIMSTILGIISLVSIGAAVYLTYKRGGNALAGYGVAGIFATAFSLIGLALGIDAVRKKDSYRLFPYLGLSFNFLALAGIGFILYLGVYR